MSRAAVTVPAEYVGELRRTVITLYGSAAEELFHLADDYLKQKEPLEVLFDQRHYLQQLDELIATIGWDHTESPGRDAELRGDRRLLATVLYGVLLELGERVPEECRGCWRATPQTRSRSARVDGRLLLELYRRTA
jgi:hypothetical protein